MEIEFQLQSLDIIVINFRARRHADDENQNRFDESLEDGCLCNKSINIYYRHVIHRKMVKRSKKARSIWVPRRST